MQNSRSNPLMPLNGGAVGRTYDDNESLKFKEESNRLTTYREWRVTDVSAIKLARYGFRCLDDNIIECAFGAEIKEVETRRYSDEEILAFHHAACPVITGVDFDNVPIRTREAEDNDENRAFLYVVHTRAPAIRARQIKIGVPDLDRVMIFAFKELYSKESIRTAIQNHFEENGLFPTRRMLFKRLES